MLNKSDIDYIKSGNSGFEVVFLTRKGGYSSSPYASLNMSYNSGDNKSGVDKNYEKFFNVFGIGQKNLIMLNQVHGDDILVIKGYKVEHNVTGNFDAVVTNDVTLCLSIMTADCVPIFLFDTNKKVFAAVHAGWKGTALGIVKKALNTMVSNFLCEPKNIHAELGPSISKCCYEIGADVLEKLLGSITKKTDTLHKTLSGKTYAHIGEFNVIQLQELGVKKEKIRYADYCTACNSNLFFSHRKEKNTGRQLNFIRYCSS